MHTRKLALALVALFILELILFTRTFDRFFTGDSLYYLSHRVTNLDELVDVFTRVDYLEEYRPLPVVLFSFGYFPLFRLDPWGYHFIPLVFHLANTWLVFRLARRLLGSDFGALIAAFFFGAHSVAFDVTYDVTMMTEFTYVFFFLIATGLFLDHCETGSRTHLAGCLACFALSLLCKESAITLLAVAPAAAVAALGSRDRRRKLLPDVAAVARRAWPLAALAAVYLLALLAVKDWSLFPRRPGHPHAAAFSLKTVLAKERFLQWSFNVPDDLVLKLAALRRLIIFAALFPFLALFGLWSVRALFVRDRAALLGLFWFVATLSPALVLPNLTMVHVLYLPVIGLALVFGSLAARAVELEWFRGRRAVAAVALLVVFLAANVNASWGFGSQHLRESWLSHGSLVAKTGLTDLRAMRPQLPPGATLYFLKTNEKDLPWFFDNGRMFNVFYGDWSFRTLFADRGVKLPERVLEDDRILIFRFIRPHVFDVTDEFKAALRETSKVELIPAFSEKHIWFDKREGCYPGYDVFDTPTGKPAFVLPVGRGRIGREALVLIAGARIRLDLPLLDERTHLAFGITMPFDAGDGAEGRIYFEHEGGRELLYSRWLCPARVDGDRQWLDEAVDLGKYAGRKGTLVLECNSGPDQDVIGDWVAWSRLRLLPAPEPGRAPAPPRVPTSLHVTPATVRPGGYVILTLGNGAGITVDCKYRINGSAIVRERWFTTSAAGQFVLQPMEPGKWEFVAIKNSATDTWVETPALLVVE